MKWFKTVYLNLRGEAARRNLTVSDLADVLGITVPMMRRRLLSRAHGGVDFSAYECRLLCEFFDKPFEWLFETSGEAA